MLRLVFPYLLCLLQMDNVPQRRGQNLLPVNLTTFFCPMLTPIQLTGGAALSERELATGCTGAHLAYNGRLYSRWGLVSRLDLNLAMLT
jgi:hypothetical protein